MRINYKGFILKPICEVTVGSTFSTPRKSESAVGIYMRIDLKSGIIKPEPKTRTMCYAVNLETGQIRPFTEDFLVEPINAEVNIVK